MLTAVSVLYLGQVLGALSERHFVFKYRMQGAPVWNMKYWLWLQMFLFLHHVPVCTWCIFTLQCVYSLHGLQQCCFDIIQIYLLVIKVLERKYKSRYNPDSKKCQYANSATEFSGWSHVRAQSAAYCHPQLVRYQRLLAACQSVWNAKGKEECVDHRYQGD